MKAELNVDIEKLVHEITEAAVIEALSKNGGTVVQHIVKAALNDKADSRGYGKKTVLQEALENAIIDVTKKHIGVWIGRNKESVEAMVATACAAILTPEFVAKNAIDCLQQMRASFTPLKAGGRVDNMEDD